MEHKYTGRELHMLKTLREIYADLEGAQDHRNDHFALVQNALGLAAPFTYTGPTDAELDALVAADRKAHGWPVKEA